MALMDEFKKERASIKNAPLKKKLQYFWDYYKWYVFGMLFLIVAICLFIRTAATHTETILYTMFFNTGSEDIYHEDMGAEFLSYAGIEDEKQLALIDVSYYMSTDESEPGVQAAFQKLSIFTQTNQLDIIGGPIDSINACMYNTYLYDLRTILTEEQFAKYEPYLLYADEAILSDKQTAEKKSEFYEMVYPDPAKPETMKKPIPVAIDVTACEKMQMIYSDSPKQLALGVAQGTIHLKQAITFIEYLFNE